MKTIILFMPAMVAGGVVTGGQETPTAQVQVRKVALFKNGYNWVELSATLPDAGLVQLTGMPNVLLGTVWWDSGTGVVSLEGSIRECTVPVASYSCAELLAANAGRWVRLTLSDGRVTEGKLSLRQQEQAPGGAFLSTAEESEDAAPRVVMLQTHTGDIVVRAEDVEVVEAATGETLEVPTRKESVPVVSARLTKPNPGATFTFGYVSNNMSWLPEYGLELGQGGMATLTARANIINEMADMNDVQLQLVSGFPALGDALIDSPLNRSVRLGEMLRKLGVTAWESREAKALTGNAVAYRAQTVAADAFSDEEAGTFGAGRGGDTKQVEELFYYTLPHFTCARGQGLVREIFTEQVPYSHIYTCTVPNQTVLEHLSSRGEPAADIWHCVKLKNTGKQAWSTGIVTCTQDNNLVARSTLYFAVPGGETLLQLNKTLQVDVLCREELVNREKRSRNNRSEDTVTVSIYTGVLTLKNDTDREMPMRLTKQVNGYVKTADGNANIAVSPSYSGNPRSTIIWEFTLCSGETLKYTYSYEFEGE